MPQPSRFFSYNMMSDHIQDSAPVVRRLSLHRNRVQSQSPEMVQVSLCKTNSSKRPLALARSIVILEEKLVPACKITETQPFACEQNRSKLHSRTIELQYAEKL